MTAEEYIAERRQKQSLITFDELSREIDYSLKDEQRKKYSLFFRPEFFRGGKDWNAWGWDDKKSECKEYYLTETGFVKVCLILIHDGKMCPKKAEKIYKKYFDKSKIL